jgi:hypothetical protein
MIISENQARLAAEYLKEHPGGSRCRPSDVSAELLDAARSAATNAPETRPDRIRDAEHYLDVGEVDSHQIAAKMIARIISDSMR